MAHRVSNFRKHYSDRQSNLRVLVDMDGVLCDFELYLLESYKQKYPNEPCIELQDREGFWVKDQYEKLKEGLGANCVNVHNCKGFFKNLPEIPGSIEAVKELSQMENVDVFLCTSPLNYYKYCMQEKYAWVEKHLGKNWLEKIIITKDKTVVNGHVLIDDKPNITGAMLQPSWEHIVFTSCHNTGTNLHGKRRLDNWTDGTWRDLIEEFKKRVG
ncbi:5'(3')-deoxyribonucleotidase [Mactra antiquata]